MNSAVKNADEMLLKIHSLELHYIVIVCTMYQYILYTSKTFDSFSGTEDLVHRDY
jgi:hypothetical protein